MINPISHRVLEAGRLCAFVAMAGVLAACAGLRSFAADTPAGAELDGVWKLNAAASDDPRRVLDRLRAEARRRAQYALPVEPTPQRSRRRGQGGGQGTGDSQQPETDDSYPVDNPQGPRQVDVRSPLVQVLGSDLLRNEVLEIHTSPNSFVIDYGSSVRHLTPGQRSVVSVPGGVADQTTGWRGRQYVVQVRSQVGPDITEEYSLAGRSGRQLIVKVHLGGSGMPSVTLTRVYEAGAGARPRSLPTVD